MARFHLSGLITLAHKKRPMFQSTWWRFLVKRVLSGLEKNKKQTRIRSSSSWSSSALGFIWSRWTECRERERGKERKREKKSRLTYRSWKEVGRSRPYCRLRSAGACKSNSWNNCELWLDISWHSSRIERSIHLNHRLGDDSTTSIQSSAFVEKLRVIVDLHPSVARWEPECRSSWLKRNASVSRPTWSITKWEAEKKAKENMQMKLTDIGVSDREMLNDPSNNQSTNEPATADLFQVVSQWRLHSRYKYLYRIPYTFK